jgi:hypothetical protein
LAALSFHFHGYQPGDLVRWTEPDPLKPPKFEERRSPVALRIGGDRIAGRNWTDAVLHAYGRMEAVLERVPGVASVDVEPQTLAWLLEKDPGAYRGVVSAWERGRAGFALTPPFHPILPHHHRLEREALFAMMIDFFAPLLRRIHDRPIGLWLPEAAYSTDAMRDFLASARRAQEHHAGLPDLVTRTHLLLDRRQLAGPAESSSAWVRLGIDGGVPAMVRDPGPSGDFAFGRATPEAFVGAAKARGAESALVASDLESLLANPEQAARFEGIVRTAKGHGIVVAAPSPSGTSRLASVVEHSSWSDYDEHLSEGHTSDTRWTGFRRTDGLVVARPHGEELVSQLWKHAFTLATERVESAVRRTARDLLPKFEVERRREIVRRLAVAYGRHLWREHYRAAGLAAAETDFARTAEGLLGGTIDVEVAAYLARAYVTMLMGLRSDPRFWDNMDTRVTFQGVACLAQSLADAAEACRRAHERDRAHRLVALLQTTLLEFPEAYARGELSSLHGFEGWEATEAAWYRAVQSEVPRRSGYDVLRRAALFALPDDVRAAIPGVHFRAEDVVADSGPIDGEAHGEWENAEWCEHRA